MIPTILGHKVVRITHFLHLRTQLAVERRYVDLAESDHVRIGILNVLHYKLEPIFPCEVLLRHFRKRRAQSLRQDVPVHDFETNPISRINLPQNGRLLPLSLDYLNLILVYDVPFGAT